MPPTSCRRTNELPQRPPTTSPPGVPTSKISSGDGPLLLHTRLRLSELDVLHDALSAASQIGWKVREPSGKAVLGWLDGSPARVAEACRHAAVADNYRARDVRGVVGGQKGVDRGDLFRPGGTVERNVRPVLRPLSRVDADALG